MKRILPLLLLAAAAIANPPTILTQPLREGSRLGAGSPTPLVSQRRFSMSQSYSMGITAGGGSTYSQGLYLNSVAYRLTDPLTLLVDFGFSTPFHASGAFAKAAPDMQSQFVLPRVGLEYQPSENLVLSLNYYRLTPGLALQPSIGAFGSPLFR